MKCKYCSYEWESRKKNPKACPRCKRRFDYPSMFSGLSNLKTNSEVIQNG